MTTEASGNYRPYQPIGSFFKGSDYIFTVTAGGVSSGPVTYPC